MLRTITGYLLAAVVISAAWLGLETGEAAGEEAIVLIVLAFLPALAVQLRRNWYIVGAIAALSALLALSVAFGVSLANARPFDDRDFFGPTLDAFQEGALAFFDTRVPFDPVQLVEMHGVVLFALFAFTAATGIAIAARRILVAVAILALGAGWPTTMLSIGPSSNRDLVLGSLILGTALALLALYRPGVRSLVPAAILGLALVVVAVGGATTNAVAKDGFVNWSRWDPYDRPDDPVDVSYVWDGNYGGIRFPDKRTTVLRIKASGLQSRLYWRATTLDVYNGAGWIEQLDPANRFDAGEDVVPAGDDPFLPAEAKKRSAQTKQEVEVEALAESRLLGSSQAVRWRTSGEDGALLMTNGAVVLNRELEQGERYTVWSYVPKDATPKVLSEAGTDYPGAIYPYLLAQPELDATALPRFGAPGRDQYMEDLFDESVDAQDHRTVYDTAKVVTAGQDTPYGATVALLSWFRGEEGGFSYTEQPPVELATKPLLSFLDTKQGYCQHFAGEMALMLRYLGIPARVAAGFTSGTYKSGADEWVVTDHDAHTWVEVFFPGVGWLTFDPTPGRGQIDAAFDPYSDRFDAREAAALGGAFLDIPEVGERAALLEARESGAGGASGAVTEVVSHRGTSIVAMMLALLLGTAVAIVLLKLVVRRVRLWRRDPRAVATACRRDLAGYLADQGKTVPSSATPRELGDVAAHAFNVDPGPFVSALTTARYGPLPAAGPGAARTLRELRRLRRTLGKRNGLYNRLRGAVSLRSLTT